MSRGLNSYVGHDTAINHSAKTFNSMVLLHNTTNYNEYTQPPYITGKTITNLQTNSTDSGR
jgi:hypothetical protein